MEYNTKKSVNDDLSKYCYLAKKDSYIEVTEWVNGEGIDVTIDNKIFQLTYGELEAIIYLKDSLNYHRNDS